MKAIVVREFGPASQMNLEDVPLPVPGPGQALIKMRAIGVNYIDVYHRTGLYPRPLPLTPGLEGAGTIESLGPGTEGLDLEPGAPVAFVDGLGAYAEYCLVPAARLVPVPPKLEFLQAAAVLLQGMTAHYLVQATFPINPGDVALVHAAAGGVGLLLTQMIKTLGGRVVATVSTEEKALAATTAGADLVVNYSRDDFEAASRGFTDGRGVDVAYDSVGQATFEKSLKSLRPRGMMVTFGNASGPVADFSPLLLSRFGSLFLTRPTLAHYVATREELLERATEVLTDVEFGRLKLTIGGEYALPDAARAHADLEARATSGKLLLIP
jgi:NADPH2:quinone reductase